MPSLHFQHYQLRTSKLVLEYLSELSTSKITFDLGFRIKHVYLRWAILLAVEIHGANMQVHCVRKCVNMCFGILITITLRQKLRLKLL